MAAGKTGRQLHDLFPDGSVIIAFAFMIGIFMLLPNLIADFSTNLMGYDTSTGRGGWQCH